MNSWLETIIADSARCCFAAVLTVLDKLNNAIRSTATIEEVVRPVIRLPLIVVKETLVDLRLIVAYILENTFLAFNLCG